MSRQVVSYDEIADDAADLFVYEPPNPLQNKKKRKRKDERTYQHRDRQLTQAEVWDDSALIAAWDDAVQDFERHHYPDVEPTSRAADIRLNEYSTEDFANDVVDEDETVHKADEADADVNSYGNGNHSAFPSSIPMPPSAGDETMRNMLMAWYFAGYYTGLHQGQQGQVTSSEKRQEAKHKEQQSSRKAPVEGEPQATKAVTTKVETQATKTNATDTEEAKHVDTALDSEKPDETSSRTIDAKNEHINTNNMQIKTTEDVQSPS